MGGGTGGETMAGRVLAGGKTAVLLLFHLLICCSGIPVVFWSVVWCSFLELCRLIGAPACVGPHPSFALSLLDLFS